MPDHTIAFGRPIGAAQRHPKAHFTIEKREIVFDSRENVDDQKRLTEMRKPQRSNAIHASIHASDLDIGREDKE
jgi:hypothetical protein